MPHKCGYKSSKLITLADVRRGRRQGLQADGWPLFRDRRHPSRRRSSVRFPDDVRRSGGEITDMMAMKVGECPETCGGLSPVAPRADIMRPV
jgi:hypothetical protein